MKTVLILDTETTGVNPKVDDCIEVAAVRYSLVHSSILDVYSAIIENEAVNAAQDINRIQKELLPMGTPAAVVWDRVKNMECDAVLAHNAPFDRSFVPAPVLKDVPWIDTYKGVTWPKQSKTRTVIQLALDHGLAVVDPHRALNDCLLLARLLSRVAELGHNVEELLSTKPQDTVRVEALVSYEEKDQAKAAGFRWEKLKKRWVRTMLPAEADALPFRTRVLT